MERLRSENHDDAGKPGERNCDLGRDAERFIRFHE
jgi:hypothetical protein